MTNLNDFQNAQQNMHGWYQRTMSLPAGPERDNAYQNYMLWKQTVESMQNVPAQQSAYSYQPAPQTQQYAPDAPKSSAGKIIAIVLSSLFGVLILGTIIVMVVVLGVSKPATGPVKDFTSTTPYVPDNEEDEEILPVPEPEEITPAPQEPQKSFEQAWRDGDNVSPVPDGVAQEIPYFTDATPNIQDFVDRSGSGVKVVFTNNPEYNCAYSLMSDTRVGGCYTPKYGKVLFMYWTEESTQQMREFITAHELSHYYQWNSDFELMYAGTREKYLSNPDWSAVIESDASCRALSWGGYPEGIDKYTSSPCTAENWDENWLNNKAAEYGIEIPAN